MCRISKKGLRCQICTGCGLCPGVPHESVSSVENAGLHVLTAESLAEEKIPFSQNGKRLAVADVGTTTIAMQLYEEDGSVQERFAAVNPQTVYGADVLSRIKAAEDAASAEEMQKMVRNALKKGLDRFRKRLPEGEELYLVVAANTTMTYLLMGWDTGELGKAPFTASNLSGAEFELDGVLCFVLPAFSAFVGGDILAGCLTYKMAEQKEITLLIDLGTNGELFLGNRDKGIGCATAAGPAFEGGVNRGIWGADMVKFLATLRREGVLDETGLLEDAYFESGIRIGNVCITQSAVRSVQLAKAAIAAGIEILLKRYGIGYESVDRIVLAGGFGYYLNPEDAAEIGLLPRGLVGRTVSGGNTALAGAMLAGRRLLVSDVESVRKELEKYRAKTTIINLAMEFGFEELYMQSIPLK